MPLLALALLLFPHPCRAANATFSRGQWSIGAGAGIALVSMGDVNDFLLARNIADGTRFDELHHGWEAGGDLRYALRDRIFLGVGGGHLTAHAEDRLGPGKIIVSGSSILVLAGTTIEDQGPIGVRVLGGVGALVDGKLVEEGVGETSGSAFLSFLGGEIEYRAIDPVGIDLTVAARAARVTRPRNAPYDLDFSGGSFRLGLRLYLSRPMN